VPDDGVELVDDDVRRRRLADDRRTHGLALLPAAHDHVHSRTQAGEPGRRRPPQGLSG
jgi:hypothetical protein